MRDTIKQFVLVLIGLLLAIPVAGWTLRGMYSLDGLQGMPLVLCEHPVAALFRIMVAMLWFAGLAIIIGRLSHRYTGLLVFGIGWTLVARNGADVGEMLRFVDESGIAARGLYLKFAAEVVLYAVPAAIVVFVLTKLTPNRYDDELNTLHPQSLTAAVVILVLSVVGTWLAVRTDDKGQTVYGVMAGCAVATAIVRLYWHQSCGSLLFLAPVVVGLVGTISSAIMIGDSPLNRYASARLWELACPMPIDYLGPGILGVALGIGLARVFGAEPDHYQLLLSDDQPTAQDIDSSDSANDRSSPFSATSR